MTHIYLDPAVVVRAVPADDRRGHRSLAPVPGAAEALRHVAEGGYELILVGELPPDIADLLGLVLRSVPDVPGQVERGDWLVVADADVCRTRRRPGLRTILVGPRRAPDHGPMTRCDMEARDLGSAAIEILAHEAMVAPNSRRRP